MPIITAIATGIYGAGVFITTLFPGSLTWLLKAGALFAANALLNRRNEPEGIPRPDRVEVFTSGPARWVVGRRRVGGVVIYWGEDWDVPGTDGDAPGADDLHLIIAVSEGTCDAIEAVWVAGERLDVKFTDEAKTTYARRGAQAGDSDTTLASLPLDLDPGAPTYWDGRAYREREGGRLLDPDNEDDAELIRRADLSGAVNVVPWLDAEASNRWDSVRTYRDRADTAVLGNPTPFTDWTTEHRLQGVAGLHIRLRQWVKRDFDDRIFKGGVPDLQFLIRGQRITFPDPDESTGTKTEWTNNAAAVRYWWHTERRGLDASSIDRNAFVDAYRTCETKITPSLPETWPGGIAPDWAEDEETLSFRRYSIDGVLTSGEDPAQIEAEFDDAWQGFAVEDGGRLYYYPGSDRINQPDAVEGEDLLELPSWQPAPSIAERTNAVTLSVEQSSFHEFNTHSLREIEDASKRDEIDEGLHLPADLGVWRWTINPAQAYSLGTITLRRARATGTLSLALPPGTQDDPIRYLTMTPGLVYTINIPEEGFAARRMVLLDKQISEEMTVSATFMDAPLGLYAPAFELPDVPTPPAHIPSRIGSLPPKPTGLAVKHLAVVSNDGSVSFRIEVSVDDSPLRKIFRLTAGDDQWEIDTASASHVFLVNVPRQSMGVTARHIDKTGARSLPARLNFTPNYSKVILPRPIWDDAIVYGGSLRLVFERVAYGAAVSGVEVRYTRLPLDSTATIPIITEDTWNSAQVLRTEAVQIVRELDVSVNALATESGRYGLFARYIAQVSGAEPVRGPLSYLREVEIDIPEQPISTVEESPLFAGVSNNLVKWDVKAGDAAGDSLLFPSHSPASGLRFDRWNGYVPDSAITTGTLPRWPFGQCAGFGQAFDDDDRNSLNIIQGGDSTWYLTNAIDLGISKRVEVKAEVFAFTPGTDRQSNLTFGSHSISAQVWASGAIVPITLPEASNATGTITYKIEGLPAGLSFAPATRTITGTPLVSTATGNARYIATDEAGGEAVITFAWSIGTSVSAPSAPTGLEVVAQQTSAVVSWSAVSNASRYEVETASSSSGPWTSAGSTVETRFDLASLTASTTYYIRVRAANGGGESAWSSVSFTTAATLTAPAVPTGLAEESKTSTSITVDWDTQSNVTSYEVRWRDDGGAYVSATTATGLFRTEFTITGLAANSTYNIQVRARNSAGPSNWSDELDITTLAASFAAPTISQVVAVDAVQDYLRITMGSYSNLNSYEFEVTSSPADGYHSATARTYTESPPGPYQIYNVRPGHEYSVRARAILQGGGQSQWSAWSTLVFGNVPGVPVSLTATATTSSVTLSWTAPSGSPTSYRVDYWPTATPSNVLFQEGITSTSKTISGLDASTSYRFEVKAVNASGAGLAASVEKTTATPAISSLAAPTNRKSIPISSSIALLEWSPVENATNYQVQHRRWGFTDFHTITTGISGTRYEFAGLESGRSYEIQIRARRSYLSSLLFSPWVSFPQITMPPEQPADYAFDSTAPITLSNGTGRRLNYSLTTTVSSNIASFQIRYRQHPDTKTNDGVVANWTILTDTIENSYSSGQRTFTGTFDPGYSSRYYEVQVRALVDAGSSVGLSNWAPCSNSVTLTNPTRTLASTIRAGVEPLTAPVPVISQSGEDPIEISIEVSLDRSQFEVFQYPANYETRLSTINGTRAFPSTGVTFAIGRWYFTKYFFIDENTSNNKTLAAGDVLVFENIARGSANSERTATSTQTTYTVVDPAENPTTPPLEVAAIETDREDNDVTFSWTQPARATGYEVRITEEDAGDLDSTLSYVAQTGAATEYTKTGGRNEHFRIAVRAYAGSGAGRLYAPARTIDYKPANDAYSVGKVTGLEEDPIGSTTRLRWREVPNADGYEIQTTSDGTWSSATTTTSAEHIVQSAGSFTARIRAYRGSGASRVFSLAWSAIAHRQYTNPGAGQVGDVESVVAIDRGETILLDWDDVVPNAGRFRIEKWTGSTWAVEQANIAVSSTAWQSDEDASLSTRFRIRGETDESDGAWTDIYWTGSTLLPVGSIEGFRLIASHQSIEARWSFPAGIFQAEVEYRQGTTGTWTSVSVERYAKSVTISSLTENVFYQVRVRAKAGERVGAWTTAGATTLQCVTLAAPASLTIAPTGSTASVSFASVAGAVEYYYESALSSSASGPWTRIGFGNPSTLTFSIMHGGQGFTAPYFLRVRVRATAAGYCAGTYATQIVNVPASGSTEAQTSTEGAIAAGTGASVSIPSGLYEESAAEPSSPLARPYFPDYIEERCFLEGTAIDAFTIPAAEGGVPPYTITITDLPAGLTFDSATRQVSGTPTASAPKEGYAIVRVEDSVGSFERRSFRWILAGSTPATWSDFGGGIGSETTPFQIECTTKGNIRPFYYRTGATNAADIEAGSAGATHQVLWLRCPTTYAHTARLIGASSPDYDLVVKVGEAYYFSDSTANVEFVRVPGHTNGALIGIYRYAATTTTDGSNNTGDPLILEWYPDVVERPPDLAGDEASIASGDVASSAATAATGRTPGKTETDAYVLYRNGKTGAWTRRATALGSSWVDIGTNAREIRFEFHFKEWENRAIRRITTFHRDRQG